MSIAGMTPPPVFSIQLQSRSKRGIQYSEAGGWMRTSPDPKNELYFEFKELTERFCKLAAGQGVSVSPYLGEGPGYFAKLSSEQQAATFSNFRRYADICHESVLNGESLVSGTQHLWRMFRRLELRPVSDLLSQIDDTDVIEIYSAHYVQIFRSFSFFLICSYTLDELLCRPFWELFRRDEELYRRMVSVTHRVLLEEIGGVHPWDVEDHTVDEIEGSARFHATVRYKLISPLYDQDGHVAAFVNVFRALSCVKTR